MNKLHTVTFILNGCLILIGCSKNDLNNKEETAFLLKTINSNFVNEQLVGTVENQFENNKLVAQIAFAPDGSETSRTTYTYKSDGLLKNLISMDANGSINFANNIEYVNGNISRIERIRNTASPPDTLYNNMSYGTGLIEVETVNTSGQIINFVEFYLNEDQLINRQIAGGTSIVVDMQNGVPISKSFNSQTASLFFEYEYLESPLPKGPWSTYWQSIFGNFNNQILNRSLTGLSDFEQTVDLQKYLISASSSLQIEYVFNSQDLPIRIEKTFSPSLKTTIHIEYQN